MKDIIKTIILDLGYITIDMLETENISNIGVVNILEHGFDLNFIQEQLLDCINTLITFTEENINIAIKGNLINDNIDNLVIHLQQKLNMPYKAVAGTARRDFPITVITISQKEFK